MIASLRRVGAQRVNNVMVPLYALPNVSGKYVAERDASGRLTVMSVEGAKIVKTGTFPLAESLQAVVAAEYDRDETPFALRPAAEQRATASRLLTALLGHLSACGAAPDLARG